MIRELATDHSDILLTGIVFVGTFLLYIIWMIWTSIISKKYIKHCEDLPKNDD
ncbi:hypothetical protein [Fluviispira multicolorata]|uniref:hypothetical protein n=1 Tax=Fluviispira multicolorata TaxID=2654512 RepID=UPI001375DBB3|nr:hypothetical protein [Fluviispira multicolorata]